MRHTIAIDKTGKQYIVDTLNRNDPQVEQPIYIKVDNIEDIMLKLSNPQKPTKTK